MFECHTGAVFGAFFCNLELKFNEFCSLKNQIVVGERAIPVEALLNLVEVRDVKRLEKVE